MHYTYSKEYVADTVFYLVLVVFPIPLADFSDKQENPLSQDIVYH